MKFLIIGLGSMGKRRIRNLLALGYSNIFGYDIRSDRKEEAKNKYNIVIVDDINSIEVDAIIISTPPDIHKDYILWSLEKKIPTFVEAGVIPEHGREIYKHKDSRNLIYPSCTFRFHPAIKDIKNIIKSNNFGKVTNFNYHSGQYLPDWHPWESIKDYYVSKKETGGAREIVVFELIWICDIFGYPIETKSFIGKTIDLECEIDDTYMIIMKYPNFFGALIVDVVSRTPTRKLIVNLEYGQILWDTKNTIVKLFDAHQKRWVYYEQPEGTTYQGYNKTIIEEMYIEEIKTFIDSIKGIAKFPYSLEENIRVLEVLEKIEKSQ
ncbi:MAG: Gfo/Idh/MocA family oxidoreductase [Candidatus Calescibacterium sp.]|nr:Gfo/Idh/MocA family oxidoreductase [Candidatus Calescibacterium sp.]MDW8132999.1 Gfo/Idh/MocA family oxidoreductase [Candidatus Calescibacterium sp.]